MRSDDNQDDWRPTADWDTLRLRADLLRRVRAFFDHRGFLEVETPILSADIVVDRHLDPFSTILCDDPRQPDIGRRMWLQTSPEFAMKRLMAAGGEAIYQVARVFRNGEQGLLHNPEFTMIEWYRRGDDLRQGMQLLSDLAEAALQRGPARRVSYAEVFESATGIDPHPATGPQLEEAARKLDVPSPDSFTHEDRDAWLELLWVERAEPTLDRQTPTIVFDYPASQAALAVVRDDHPPVAERFELYYGGVELANGYHELLDPDVLKRRNESANLARRADGKPELPERSRLLKAMSQLPPCAGVAMGFDRLVMAVAGCSRIDEAIAFPIERA